MREIERAADGIVGRRQRQGNAALVMRIGLDGGHRSDRLSEEPAHGAIVVVMHRRRGPVAFGRKIISGMMMMMAAVGRFTGGRVMRMIVHQAASRDGQQIGSQRQRSEQRMFARSDHNDNG